MKFKENDIVIIKAYLPFNYETGKIFSYSKEKQMYKVIWFLDNLNPHSFWKWCYIKEEDIEFANKVIDIRPYKNSFKETPKLYPKDYVEFYNNDFYLAKKVYEGILSKEDYFKILKK